MFTRRLNLIHASLALIVAGAAILIVAGKASSSTPASCTPIDVVVWLKGRGNSTAGSAYYVLGLTNLSRRRCALRGYPGVSGVDVASRQLGTAAGRNRQTPVRLVILAPGSSPRVVLQVNDPDVFPPSACKPVTAAGLRVYLPQSTHASIVPVPFEACSRTGPAYLHVAAVTS